jgi:hypothetical protein
MDRESDASVSAFTYVIQDFADEQRLPRADVDAISLYANFILNTTPGLRPSDAARRAVSKFRENPERIRNRKSGCDPDTGRRPW